MAKGLDGHIEPSSNSWPKSAYHRLEYLDYADRDNARFMDALKIQNGVPSISLPGARNPFEELISELPRLHVAGVVRALASALDWVAGAIVGVAELPISILRGDFRNVRTHLNKSSIAPKRAKIEAEFGDRLGAANLSDAGSAPGV
jgi:hypothetical protein